MTDTEPELTVVAGYIVAYRLFDVAYAIDLGLAERVWATRSRSASARSRLTATPAKAVAFDVPPLVLGLDPVTLTLDGAPATAAVTARLYDFGVVSLALRVGANGLAWSAFAARLGAVDRSLGLATGNPLWSELLGHVRRGVDGALERPSPSTLEEDYLLGVANAFDEPLTAEALQRRVDLAPLLSGEERRLSDAARHDVLRHRYSYYTDDLVALTWDRAFIYEPRGDSDVIDALEVANAQLLEMRYYDELLDAELPRMYDLVEATRRTRGLLAARRFSGLARRLYTLVAEVTELTERVDNALQVTEDVYLARIYAAALELFRVPTVSAAVERKLSIIRDTYAALYDEASGSRSELLEIVILVLIAAEIILAVLRH